MKNGVFIAVLGLSLMALGGCAGSSALPQLEESRGASTQAGVESTPSPAPEMVEGAATAETASETCTETTAAASTDPSAPATSRARCGNTDTRFVLTWPRLVAGKQATFTGTLERYVNRRWQALPTRPVILRLRDTSNNLLAEQKVTCRSTGKFDIVQVPPGQPKQTLRAELEFPCDVTYARESRTASLYLNVK